MKKVFSIILLCGLLLSTPTYAYVVVIKESPMIRSS